MAGRQWSVVGRQLTARAGGCGVPRWQSPGGRAGNAGKMDGRCRNCSHKFAYVRICSDMFAYWENQREAPSVQAPSSQHRRSSKIQAPSGLKGSHWFAFAHLCTPLRSLLQLRAKKVFFRSAVARSASAFALCIMADKGADPGLGIGAGCVVRVGRRRRARSRYGTGGSV
jgi:hypothetical protein